MECGRSRQRPNLGVVLRSGPGRQLFASGRRAAASDSLSPVDTAITGHTILRGGAHAPPSRFLRLDSPGLANLLVTGGCGGDRVRVAREFHQASRLRRGPFIATTARREDWPSTLLRALSGSLGRREHDPLRESEGGTLFLDEIEHLDMNTQRLLAEFLRRGRSEGSRDSGWAGRIAAGAAGDLGPLVSSGRFLAPLQDALDKLRIDLGTDH